MSDRLDITTVLVRVAATTIMLLGLILLHRPVVTEGNLALHGSLDMVGHLITGVVVASGVRSLQLPVSVMWICVGSVVVDMGHLLGWLGAFEPLQGSSRNGFHSLITVVLIACTGFVDQRRAATWLALAMGATSHLWRDMGTGTVALLWPLTETVYGTTYTRYVAVLGGVSIAMIGTSALLAVHARTQQEG